MVLNPMTGAEVGFGTPEYYALTTAPRYAPVTPGSPPLLNPITGETVHWNDPGYAALTQKRLVPTPNPVGDPVYPGTPEWYALNTKPWYDPVPAGSKPILDPINGQTINPDDPRYAAATQPGHYGPKPETAPPVVTPPAPAAHVIERPAATAETFAASGQTPPEAAHAAAVANAISPPTAAPAAIASSAPRAPAAAPVPTFDAGFQAAVKNSFKAAPVAAVKPAGAPAIAAPRTVDRALSAGASRSTGSGRLVG